MIRKFAKSKTLWVNLAAICTGVGAYVSGEIGTPELIGVLFLAGNNIAMRWGVLKSERRANA